METKAIKISGQILSRAELKTIIGGDDGGIPPVGCKTSSCTIVTPCGNLFGRCEENPANECVCTSDYYNQSALDNSCKN